MGSEKEQKKLGYKSLLQKIGQNFTQINADYIFSHSQNKNLKEAWFAYGIVKTLLQNADLITYASLRSKQDLSDSIETHKSKYLEMFQNDEDSRETSLIFQTNLTNLASSCNNSKPVNNNLSAQELDIIRDLVTDLLQKSQSLFAEQAFNQDTVDKLQASSIVFNMLQLPIKQQIVLLDKLLLVKELWQIEHLNTDSNNPEQNFKMAFNLNPAKIVNEIEAADAETAFEKLTNLFIDAQHVLQNLSNERMVELYDRLKNFEPQTQVLNDILQKIHREAQFRYGYNRLSDSGYELLKRFQSYDAIAHQIETAEFAISESYLLKKANFLQETINTISKHVDNIKAVGAAKILEVKNVVNKLNQQIINLHLEEHAASNTLSSIISKLDAGIDSNIYKRYAELDKFAVSSLKNRYENFFMSLNQLLEGKKESNNFLQQSIVRKLAQDYYVSNLSNSATKLKAMVGERTEIAKQLLEIDFVGTFSPEHINTMTSLNLKKTLKNNQPRNPADYVQSLINVFVSQASAAQLENLYRPLKGDLSEVQSILKHEIVKQIKQRTTITKMFYSIFTGKKKEFDKLKNIKKFLQPSFIKNIGLEEMEKVKNTPSEIKKEIEDLAKKSAENEGMINKIKKVDTETETLNN